MGRIRTTKGSLIVHASEIVGYKSGLALDKPTIIDYAADYENLEGNDEDPIVIRSEEFQYLIQGLLYRVGNIPSPEILLPPTALRLKYAKRKGWEGALDGVLDMAPAALQAALDKTTATGAKSLDPEPFFRQAVEKFGLKGGRIVLDFFDALDLYQHADPWGRIRRVEWKNKEELSSLFESEGLAAMHGTFLDQRFIDYLDANFPDIDKINWRKFEALTCEFFDRTGHRVEIGIGRNDGSIDARIWPAEDDKNSAPAILVQCKREKRKVEKVVVKSLYADILAEGAESGLIVTTTALSPGSRTVLKARNYPIQEANRETLREWITRMRTPFAGVFLGE